MVTDWMSDYEIMNHIRREFDSSLEWRTNLELKNQYEYEQEGRPSPLTSEWFQHTTTNGISIRLRFHNSTLGSALSITEDIVTEFATKLHGHCFGFFLPNNRVLVFQRHSLERYAERILGDKTVSINDVFYDHILPGINNSYLIVLPARTHRYTTYIGIAKGLFVGDYFEENTVNDTKFNWISTCLPDDEELGYTQRNVKSVLEKLSVFSNNYDFCSIDAKVFDSMVDVILDNPELKKACEEFYTNVLLLLKLHLDYKMEITVSQIEDINSTIETTKYILTRLGIKNFDGISPFSKKRGIAVRGELNYQG